MVEKSYIVLGVSAAGLAPTTLRRLEGFQVKAARLMTGLLPKMPGGTWKYPKTKTVLIALGLHTIEH